MAGFFSKLFGGKKKNDIIETIEDTLDGIIEKADLDLSFEVTGTKENHYSVEVFGEDEGLLKTKDGQLLDALQLFMTRSLQHYFSEIKISIEFDSNGFRENANKELLELADKLKEIVLSKKKAVFFRALAPKDRKTVHQYLSDDSRVKSKSIGEGLFKKIKIFPASQERKKPKGPKNSVAEKTN